MTTSDESWSAKLRIIGDLERPDHHLLVEGDRCAFLGSYTAYAGFAHSTTNQIITNLKKSPSVRGTPQWQHKLRTIEQVGATIARNVGANSWHRTVFVPIPPSKAKGSPEYDDRMLRVALAMGNKADVREVLTTRADRQAMHSTGGRRDPNALRASIAVTNDLCYGNPEQVVLLDDVLTTGCSYSVCKELVRQIWPHAQVTGVFVARRVIANPFESLDVDV